MAQAPVQATQQATAPSVEVLPPEEEPEPTTKTGKLLKDQPWRKMGGWDDSEEG